MNITTLIYEASKRYPFKAAIIENEQEISYRDLWESIKKFAAAFYGIGIRKNHRIALALPNGTEFIYYFFALLKINAVFSPLSPDLTSFEIEKVFSNLNPHAIIAEPEFIENVLSGCPSLSLEDKIILQDTTPLRRSINNCYLVKNLNSEEGNRSVTGTETKLDHIATINYTYRGIGYPLGALLSHKNYVEGVLAYIENTEMGSQHRVLSLLPLSHVYPLVGCMLAPLASGATIIISRNYMPKSIIKKIGAYTINHITLVPLIYNLLLQHYRKDEYDIGSLTCCITGGAYMPPEVQAEIKDRMGIKMYQGYGLTECLPVTWNRYRYNKAGTLGLPLRQDFRIRIVDDEGNRKGTSEVGEIVVHAPTVTQGYYNQQEVTREAVKDGWFYTGDYGYLDEQGYLYFTGLKKNVAKVGGNMVDLKEVKDVLLSHPAVSEAIVYAKEDSIWGHIILAEVNTRPSEEATEKELKAFCIKRLSRHKVPKKMYWLG
jgi:long-chain acyl-CoA synthetase